MLPLAQAISSLHQEHMRNEDFEGFCHDLSILVSQGLNDGLDDEEMTSHISEYITELKEVNEEE